MFLPSFCAGNIHSATHVGAALAATIPIEIFEEGGSTLEEEGGDSLAFTDPGENDFGGGAVYFNGNNAEFKSCRFEGNTADHGKIPAGQDPITTMGGALLLAGGNVTISNCSFVRNGATGGMCMISERGESTTEPCDGGGATGGAICYLYICSDRDICKARGPAYLRVLSTQIVENNAQGGNGTVRGGFAAGGAISAFYTSKTGPHTGGWPVRFDLHNVTFSMNVASGGRGPVAPLRGGDALGGAIYADGLNKGRVNISLSSFNGNSAIGGDGTSGDYAFRRVHEVLRFFLQVHYR